MKLRLTCGSGIDRRRSAIKFVIYVRCFSYMFVVCHICSLFVKLSNCHYTTKLFHFKSKQYDGGKEELR